MGSRYITAGVWRGNALEWTTLAEGKGGWRVVAQREVADAAPAPAVVRAHRAAWKGRVILAVPSAQTLLRVLSLPSTDPAELRGMAELQLDKFSPFPAEQMLTSVETLGQDDKSSRVLVAVAQRERMDALGAPWLQAGYLPDSVDVDLLAWWHLVGARAPQAAGCDVLLLLRPVGVDLVATQAGEPVLFRSLDATGEGASGLSGADLLEEINYTLINLETEGDVAKPRFTVWSAADAPPEWRAALQQLPGEPPEFHELQELPRLSEGLARRAAQSAGRSINLAPADWAASRRQRQMQRGVTLLAAVLTGVWLLGLAVLLGGSQWQRYRVAGLTATLRNLEKPAERVGEQLKRAETLEQYADHSRSALEVLREISQRLPSGVKLTSFIYRKNNSVALRGEADAPEMIYGLLRDLEQCKLFAQVKAEGITRAPASAGGQRTQFGLTLMLAGGPA